MSAYRDLIPPSMIRVGSAASQHFSGAFVGQTASATSSALAAPIDQFIHSNAASSEPPHERLVHFLDKNLGSRQGSMQLWGELKELIAHPILQQIAASQAFGEIAARKREYETFEQLGQAFSDHQGDFNLGFFQKIRLWAMLKSWEPSLPLLRGFVGEYAQISKFPEGMSALEIALFLTRLPQVEGITTGIFKDVDRSLTV